MKFSKIIVIAAVAAALASCGNTPEGSKEVRAILPTTSQVDSASYLLGVNFGMMIQNYGFGKLNYTQLLKGIKAAANAQGDPNDSTWVNQFRISPMEMGRVLDGHLEKMHEYKAALNDEKGAEFIEKYKNENQDAQVTESGLVYRIVEEGEATRATSLQDTVIVNYKGTLIDGTQFDANDSTEFALNRVISGWGEGMQLVGKGGTIELVVPGELAYGDRGTRGIEPNSTLKFEVKLVDVKPFVAKPADDEKK